MHGENLILHTDFKLKYVFDLDKKLTTFILNLFPRPDLWIILNIKPNIIWKRKQEIKYKVLLKQIKNYKKFANKKKKFNFIL